MRPVAMGNSVTSLPNIAGPVYISRYAIKVDI